MSLGQDYMYLLRSTLTWRREHWPWAAQSVARVPKWRGGRKAQGMELLPAGNWKASRPGQKIRAAEMKRTWTRPKNTHLDGACDEKRGVGLCAHDSVL